MPRRQTSPDRWLLVTESNREQVLRLARRLPPGSGILLLTPIAAAQMRRLRHIARSRNLSIEAERPRTAARIHGLRDLRRALLDRTELLMLSPIFATQTHPRWLPLQRMRAAALARLGGRRLIALGGMNARRYAQVAQLGFRGWAGISAFRT